MSPVSNGISLFWLGRWAIPQGRYDVMRLDKYFQKKGYSNYRFRYVRCKVNRFLNEDYRVREPVSRHPHKVEKWVQFPYPEHSSCVSLPPQTTSEQSIPSCPR